MFKKSPCFFFCILFFVINAMQNDLNQRYLLKIKWLPKVSDFDFIKNYSHKFFLQQSLNNLDKLKSEFKLDTVSDKNAFKLLELCIKHNEHEKKIKAMLGDVNTEGFFAGIQRNSNQAINSVNDLANRIPELIDNQVNKTMGVQNAFKKALENIQELINKVSCLFKNDISLNKKIVLSLSTVSVFFLVKLIYAYLKKYNIDNELKTNVERDFLRYLNEAQCKKPIIEALKENIHRKVHDTLSSDWSRELIDNCTNRNSNRIINFWGFFGTSVLSGVTFFYKQIYFSAMYLFKSIIFRYKRIEERHNEEKADIEAYLKKELNMLNENCQRIEEDILKLSSEKEKISDAIQQYLLNQTDLEDKKQTVFKEVKSIQKNIEEFNKKKTIPKLKNFFEIQINYILNLNVEEDNCKDYETIFNNFIKEDVGEDNEDDLNALNTISCSVLIYMNHIYSIQNQHNELQKALSVLDDRQKKIITDIEEQKNRLKDFYNTKDMEKNKIKYLLLQINPQREELAAESLEEKFVGEVPSSYEGFVREISEEEINRSLHNIKDSDSNKDKCKNVSSKEQKIEDRIKNVKYKNLFFNKKHLGVLIFVPFFIWIVLKYTKHDQVIIDFFNECGKDFKQQINKFFSFIYDNIVSALKESHEFLKPAVTPLICVGSLLTCYLFFMHYVKKYTIDGLTEDLCEGENKRLLGFIAYVKKKLDESDNKEADKKASKIKGIQGGIKEEQEIDFSGLGYARLIELYYNKLDFVFIDELCPDTIFNIEKDYDKKLFQFLMHCKKIYYDIIQSKNKQSTALKDIKSIISLIPSLSTLQSRNKIDSLSHFRNRSDLNIMDFIEDLQTVAYNKKKYGDLKSILDRLKKYIKDKKHEEEEEEAQLAEYCESESFYSISNNSELSSSEKSHSKRVFFRVD